MKKAAIFLLIACVLVGFLLPNGIRAAIANNLWSVRFLQQVLSKQVLAPDLLTPPSTHAQASLLLANQAANQDKLDLAEKYLLPLIQASHPLALETYAKILYAQGNYEQAIQTFGQIKKLSALYRIAQDVRAMARQDLILLTAKTLYEIEHEHHTSGYVSVLPDAAEQIVVLNRSIRDFPNSSNYQTWLKMLGDISKQQQSWPEAEAAYQQILAQNYGDTKSWSALCWLYYDRDQNLTEVIPCFEREMSSLPGNGHAYFELARAYQLDNQPDLALGAIEKALALMSTPQSDYYLRAASIYEQQGFTAKALEAYKSALELDPKSALAQQGIDRLQGSK